MSKFWTLPRLLSEYDYDSDRTVAVLFITASPDGFYDDWSAQDAYMEVYAPTASAFTFTGNGLVVTDIENTTHFIPQTHLGYCYIEEQRYGDVLRWNSDRKKSSR